MNIIETIFNIGVYIFAFNLWLTTGAVLLYYIDPDHLDRGEGASDFLITWFFWPVVIVLGWLADDADESDTTES